MNISFPVAGGFELPQRQFAADTVAPVGAVPGHAIPSRTNVSRETLAVRVTVASFRTSESPLNFRKKEGIEEGDVEHLRELAPAGELIHNALVDLHAPTGGALSRMPEQQTLFGSEIEITDVYSPSAAVTLHHGDRLDLLNAIPSGEASLVVTSPPYNIGKEYEERQGMGDYIESQAETIAEAVRICADDGSICWEVGNYVENGEIRPLDILLYPIFMSHGLKLRNRIVWHFGHGLHCSRRFSGRYEVILWFTKTDDYVFNLDAVRVPQKYPGKKHYKGPKAGTNSCNPKGKNPSDVWTMPNVKANHREKTVHPCQFPVALIERLVLALTAPGDLVVDPYVGVGTTAVASVLNERRAAGADIMQEYLDIARQRVQEAGEGTLKYRPIDKPIYDPDLPNGGHS